MSAAESAAASPEAALSAFSVNGRSHEANAVASFDRSVAERLKRCADGVDALKALAAASGASVNAQHAEHSHLVVLHLYALLERISATWARIRQRRLQRASTVRANKNNMYIHLASLLAVHSLIHQFDSKIPTKQLDNNEDAEALLLEAMRDESSSSATTAASSSDTALHLGAAEREQLLVENTALLGRLRTDIDAARELERSVARVGVLQRVFASKMAEQAEQIDHVHAVMGDARAAVSRGNEELIVATATGVDFRIFVLMFLITMSVALLFLDWYS